MAAAGSAIGLGNIWRFPYVTGQNGGAAFVLLYLGCVLLICLPYLLAELALGRHSQKNPVGAIRAIRRGTPWTLVGGLCVLTGVFILSYYSVIAGWALGYVFKSIFNPSGEFGTFIASPGLVIPLFALFICLTMLIVYGGVEKGIERWSKVLMPMLIVLIILVIIRGVTLPGAGEGLSFYLKPDFSRVDGNVMLSALGQAFFSLSLGMGAMITYGSYLSKQEDLLAQRGVNDYWHVMGQHTEVNDRLRSRRVWLFGERTRQYALLLDFAHGSTAFEHHFSNGTAFTATLVYYPGAVPMRAAIKARQATTYPENTLPGFDCASIADALDRYASALARNPWLDRMPLGLSAVTPYSVQGKTFIRDTAGAVLPVTTRTHPWFFATVSGNRLLPVKQYLAGLPLMLDAVRAEAFDLRFRGEEWIFQRRLDEAAALGVEHVDQIPGAHVITGLSCLQGAAAGGNCLLARFDGSGGGINIQVARARALHYVSLSLQVELARLHILAGRLATGRRGAATGKQRYGEVQLDGGGFLVLDGDVFNIALIATVAERACKCRQMAAFRRIGAGFRCAGTELRGL